jgi:diguanylate cyclase (GGDEF)-like protein
LAGVAEYGPEWDAWLGQPAAQCQTLEAWLSRIHPQDLFRVHRELRLLLDGVTQEFHCEHRLRLPDGDYCWVECRARLRRDAEGAVVSLEGVFTDIGERKQRDPLTGLWNHAGLQARWDRAVSGGPWMLAVADLDDFSAVNERYGHSGGDEVLLEVAARLREAVARWPGGAEALLARTGPDEFTVLAPEPGEPPLATALLACLERAVPLAEEFLRVTACVGCARVSPDCGPEEALRQAGLALRHARATGRGSCATFDPAMTERACFRAVIVRDLRHAVEQRQLAAYYQPLVELHTGRVRGFEALLRWRHPQLGLVSPADFIPPAEETGWILELGEWILREACQQLRSWQRATRLPLRMHVNLSPRQLADPRLPRAVAESLAATGVAPEDLGLELTETPLVDEVPRVREALAALRRQGVHLLLDDFGTGYAGLSYLHALPFDGFKIDRSFVSRMDADPASLAIVRGVAQLARDLHTEAIAEGIETPKHVRLLLELGIAAGQGALFSQPAPAPDAERMLQRGFARVA